MPLLWLTTAFLIGIWLGSVTSLPKIITFSVFAISVLLAILEKRLTLRIEFLQKWRKISPLPMAVLLAALVLGAWRYPPPPQLGLPGTIASFNNRGESTLTALVTSLPEESDRSTRFVADSIATTNPDGVEQLLSGKIQVEVWAGTKVNYGDLIRISGKPETPPENESFSYEDYLARKDIHSLISFPRMEVVSSGHGNPLLAILYRFRLKGYEVLNSILPQPQAALLSGILLGLDQDLPDDLVLAFQETGTAHIIAISGFNIAIISAFFFWLFRLLATRWKAFFFSVMAILLYALLVGAEPAVMRAAIMGTMAILGTQIGRRGSGLNTLVFTAALMCFLILIFSGMSVSNYLSPPHLV